MFANFNSLEERKNLIMGIACVSCEIFNFVHHSISYEFERHREVFSTGTKTAFDSLILFVKDIAITMPNDLKEYLQKTIKRFFVYEIW